MKIIYLFFIILSLSSVKALDDTLNMYFDLEGVVPGFQTELHIMNAGRFNSEVARFANSIAIPANVSRCKLRWHAGEGKGTTYKAKVIADQPENLGVALDIPSKGSVTTYVQEFFIYFTCHQLGTYKMTLKLQFFNKDGTEEYEGFEIYPSHICSQIDYDPCTYYHDSIPAKKRSTIEFTSVNLQPYDVDTIERFKTIYENLYSSTTVLSIQGATSDVREQLTKTVLNTYKYRIPYPHKKDEEQSAPLYLMSANPIYTCNYFEFDENHEYGAVIAGIAMGENRIAFVINALFPPLVEENYEAVIKQVTEELDKAVTAFMEDHPKYFVDGYFMGDVNFDTDFETTFMKELNSTIGETIGTNHPGNGLVLGYYKKTTNTTVTSYQTKTIGNKNYTYDEGYFIGAVKDGALVTKISLGQDPVPDDTSDSASDLFSLMCLILSFISILIIM